jgi:peroxiredoxin
MAPPTPIEFWLGLSALVGVFGIGYGIAATAPYRHWAVVLIGLLSKLSATGGMAYAYATKALPENFAYLTIVNDLIWILPFALILRGAWRAHRGIPARSAATSSTAPGATTGSTPDAASPSANAAAYQAAESAALATITRQATLHRGHMLCAVSLRELSDQHPTLLVFLRHTGCPFCRDVLANLAKQRAGIEARGLTIVLIHQSPPLVAAKFFDRLGLDTPEPLYHVSDPDRRLYTAFELAQVKRTQLFSPGELIRGFNTAIIKRRLFAFPQGDPRQLGGAIVFYRRRVLKAFRAARASDAIDIAETSNCRIDPPAPAAAAAPSAPASRRPAVP